MVLKKKEISKKIRFTATVWLGFLFALSLVGLYLVYHAPATQEKEVSVYNYEHKGEIGYQALVRPSIINPQTMLGPGEPFFYTLLESLNTLHSYQFQGDKPALIKGTYSVVATLESKEMWQKDFILIPPTEFSAKGQNASIDMERPVNLAYFQALLEQIEDELGVSAREPKLTVKQNIHVEATTEDGTIKEQLSPTMIIPITTGAISVEGELSMPGRGSLTKTIIVPDRTMGTLQNNFVYLIFGAVFIGLAWLAFVILTINKVVITNKYQQEMDWIRKNHRERIVQVNGNIPAAARISLNSFGDLAKVADELSKPIVNQIPCERGEKQFYCVFDGPTAYIYTLSNNEPAAGQRVAPETKAKKQAVENATIQR